MMKVDEEELRLELCLARASGRVSDELGKLLLSIAHLATKSVLHRNDEDLASAGVLKLLQSLGRYSSSKGTAFSYLFTVARNKVLDELRKENRRRKRELLMAQMTQRQRRRGKC